MTTIHVTYDLTQRGVPANCGLCPIALALDAVLHQEVDCRVYMASIYLQRWKEGEPSILLDLPQTAVDFIRAFDAGSGAEPFSFDLDIPARFLK